MKLFINILLLLLVKTSFGSPLNLKLQIKEATLPNGLHLIVLEDHKAPLFSYQTWFNVGSSDELPGKSGIAHFFEHLMFSGTKKYPLGKYDELIEAHGGTNNAFTTNDVTAYYVDISKDQLELIVNLESDRIHNLIINDQIIAREKNVVLEERKQRLENDLIGRANELLFLSSFPDSPYGIPTIGLKKDIENLSLKDCEEFYRTYYSPNNATIVVAGDVNFDQVLKLVKKYYGSIPASKIAARQPIPITKKPLPYVALKMPSQGEVLAMGYRIPPIKEADFYPLNLLIQILFQGASSRTERILIYEKKLVTEVIGNLTLRKTPSLFYVYAYPHTGVSAKKIEDELIEIFKNISEKGVSEDELNKARNQRLSSTVVNLRRAMGLASNLAYFQLMFGDYNRLLTDLDQYQKVTTNDIKIAAKKLFDSSSMTVVVVMPETKK